MVYVARTNVLADQQLVAGEVLEDHADALAQCLLLPFAKVEAVEKNTTPLRGIEPGQQLDERRLARAVLTDQGQRLTGPDVQVDTLKRRSRCARICKGDTFESNAVLGHRTRFFCVDAFCNRRLEILIEGREIEIVLIHAADRGQHGGHRRLALAEEHEIHGHLTDRDAARHGHRGNPDIGAVERQGADEPEPKAPAVATDRQCTIILIQTPEDLAVTIQQQGTKTKQLDLLGVVLACQYGFQVHLHAGLGRAPAK